MGLFDDANDLINKTLTTSAGTPIVYTRGASSVNLTAWIGRTVFASNLQSNARVEFGEIDLLIEADQLILNGSVTTPVKGDRIAITLQGNPLTLELMIPATGEPAWRYSDPQRSRLRVHCKRVV